MPPNAHLWPRRKPLFILPAAQARKQDSVFSVPLIAANRSRKQKRGPHMAVTDATRAAVEDIRRRNSLRKDGQQTLFDVTDYIEVAVDEGDVPLRQRSLADLPPAPDRREPLLPESVKQARTWVTDRWLAGAWHGKPASTLARVLDDMMTDSVIYASPDSEWRLELVELNEAGGWPFYGLFWGTCTVGIVEIPVNVKAGQGPKDYLKMPVLQYDLARWLTGVGFTAAWAQRTHIMGVSKTPRTFEKRGVHRLFRVDRGQDKSEGDE